MQHATLVLDSGTPTSQLFDDIYFSPNDGIGESKYNFLDGNNLAHRFNDYQHSDANTPFTIAETGFGTGLNFLLTAQLWVDCLQQSPNKATKQLHYISAEKHPISLTQLQQLYRLQNWQSDCAQQLLAHYPTTTKSVHHLSFQNQYSGITLTLLLGDALTQFQQFSFCADAWFLDGFAPSKNPDLWSTELFHILANRSRIGTTFATFTAASAVRKGLQDAGFTVLKSKGFGHKRERLLGYL